MMKPVKALSDVRPGPAGFGYIAALTFWYPCLTYVPPAQQQGWACPRSPSSPGQNLLSCCFATDVAC